MIWSKGNWIASNESAIFHEHWQDYIKTGQLPAPPWVYCGIGLFMTVLGIFGLVGNVVLLGVFICCKSLRSPSNFLIANMALSDLGISIGTFPFISLSAFAKHWLFGEQGCIFHALWVGHFAFLNIGSMTIIAIDRYFSITKRSYWNLTYAGASLMILITWIFAFVLVIPPFFGWTDYILDSLQISCTFDFLTISPLHTTFALYIFALGFVFPLIIIFVCYTFIIRHFFRHRQVMKNAQVTRCRPSTSIQISNGSGNLVDYSFRATVTSIVIVFLYCLVWTPYAIVPLIGVLGDQRLLTPLATIIPNLFAKTSAIYNPIVYAFLNKKFRRIFCAAESLTRRLLHSPLTDAENIRLRPVIRVTLSEPAIASTHAVDVTAISVVPRKQLKKAQVFLVGETSM